MKKKLKSKMEFGLFYIFFLVFRLFPYKMNKFLVTRIAIFAGLFIGIRKKVAVQNLHMIFPEKSSTEIRIILKEMYRQLGLTACETYFGDINKLYSNFKVIGMENLEEALALNKGAIVASGHFGNWELAGRFIAQKHKLSVIYKKLRNQYFDEFNNKIRNDENCVLIEKKQALRKILKLLAEKYIVTIMVDQKAKKHGVLIDFMGYPASTFIGTAKIAIKTNTPIVPGIALRDKNDCNYLILEPMIDVSQYGNSSESIMQLTQDVSKRVEKYAFQFPEQWFWVHRRWRKNHKLRSRIDHEKSLQ